MNLTPPKKKGYMTSTLSTFFWHQNIQIFQNDCWVPPQSPYIFVPPVTTFEPWLIITDVYVDKRSFTFNYCQHNWEEVVQLNLYLDVPGS